MNKIEDMFASSEKIYEVKMSPIPQANLVAYCKLFKLSIDKYFYRPSVDKYFIPGLYVLDMFRETIEKLHGADESFPISQVDGIDPGCTSTLENRIFVNDELNFQTQIRCISKDSHKIKIVCRIQIYRNTSIVFAGMFNFYQNK